MNKLSVFLFFLVTYLIHVIVVLLFSNQINYLFITKTYIFLFLMYIVVLFLRKLIKKLILKSPYLVLSISLFKMGASLIYLLPLLKNKITATDYILHFFIAYFIFLIQDIVENRKQIEIKK